MRELGVDRVPVITQRYTSKQSSLLPRPSKFKYLVPGVLTGLFEFVLGDWLFKMRFVLFNCWYPWKLEECELGSNKKFLSSNSKKDRDRSWSISWRIFILYLLLQLLRCKSCSENRWVWAQKTYCSSLSRPAFPRNSKYTLLPVFLARINIYSPCN